MSNEPDDDVQDAELLPDNPFADRPETRQPMPPRAPVTAADLGQDAGVRMLLPVGRSVWAIVAGYMALFIPIMCVTAPIALFCGIMALREIRQNPKLHGKGRAWFGIIAGAIGLVGLCFFAVLLVAEAINS